MLTPRGITTDVHHVFIIYHNTRYPIIELILPMLQ